MTLFARWIDMFWRPFLTVLHLSQTIISYIIVPFEITNVLNGYYRCLIYFTKSLHRFMQTSFTLYSVIGYTEIKITGDRKSTRLNSSHVSISYAVFCLKKKWYVQSAR